MQKYYNFLTGYLLIYTPMIQVYIMYFPSALYYDCTDKCSISSSSLALFIFLLPLEYR